MLAHNYLLFAAFLKECLFFGNNFTLKDILIVRSEFYENQIVDKGRVALTKWMNFRKSFKGAAGGGAFSIQKFVL